jgi:hypothetical protein
MIDAVILLILIALVVAIAKAVMSKGRYDKMSEQEFNEEAKRVSMRGAGVAEFQRIVDPSHKVEYLQLRDKKVEAEETDAGDRPEAGGSVKTKEERGDED